MGILSSERNAQKVQLPYVHAPKRFGFNSEELNVIDKGYVRPLLEYGDVVWGASLTCDQSTTLDKVQKRACRIMLGKKYSSYTDAID